MEKFNSGKVSIYDLMLYIKKRYYISTPTPVLNINFIGDLDESDKESIFAYFKIEEDDEEAKKAIGLCETEHITKMLSSAEKEEEKRREEREEMEEEEEEEEEEERKEEERKEEERKEEERKEEEEKKKCRSYLFNDDSTLKCDILDDNNKEIIYSLLFIKDGIFLEDYKTKQIVSKTGYNPEILQFMINAILSGNYVFLKKNNRGVSMANIAFKYFSEYLLLSEIRKIFDYPGHNNEEITKNVLPLIRTVSEAGQINSFKYLLLNGYFNNKDIKKIVNSILLSGNIEMIRIAAQNWFKDLKPVDFLSAFCRADDDVVRFLFNSFSGFKKFLRNNMKMTISLFTAINSPAVAAFLLNEFAIDLKSKEGFFAFFCAIKGGQYDVFKFLINEYIIIDMENTASNDCTNLLFNAIHLGLYKAVAFDQFEIANYLLSKFEVNLSGGYKEIGETVFHCAARQKNKKMINLLLSKNRKILENKNKINFYALDKSKCSALNYLILDKNPLFHSLVKEYKINLAALEKMSSITPFYCFVKSGDINMVKQYIKGGIDINRQYGDRLETVIYVAIISNNIEMVKLLLEHPEIDLNIPTKDDEDKDGFYLPITVAAEEVDVDVKILQLLLSHRKLNVNATDSFESTALHWAALMGSTNKVKALLSRSDLNLNMVDIDGNSILYCCYRDEEEVEIEIINMLLRDERLETTTEELDLIEEIVLENPRYSHSGILEFFRLAEEIKCKIMKNDIKSIDNNFIINRIKKLLELKDKGMNEEEEEEEQIDKNKNYDMVILNIAINEGNKEIFDMLISSKGDINSLNLYGVPPLSIAIVNDNIEFVQTLLLREDLNVNIVDHRQLKPINYAVRLAKRTGNFDILKILINDSRFEISDEEIEMFGQRDGYLDNFSRMAKEEPYSKTMDIEVVNILREAKDRNDFVKSQKHLAKNMSDVISKKFNDDDKHYDGKPL